MSRAVAHLLELLLGLGIAEAAAPEQSVFQVLGKDKFVKIGICIHMLPSFSVSKYVLSDNILAYTSKDFNEQKS